jgi:hypothetical protein
MSGRLKNIAVPGMRFGAGVVIDPEVRIAERVPRGRSSTYKRRYARLRCDCGTVYLAALTYLFSGRTKGCQNCSRKRPRKVGGRVKSSGCGFTVEVYCGYYPTREAAEKIAARSRAVLLPEVPPKSL